MISRSGFIAMPTVVTPSYRSGRSLVDWQMPTRSRFSRLQICATAGEVATRRTSPLSLAVFVLAGFLRVLVDAAGDGQRHHTG